MHTVFALLCFVVVIHWLIFPYPSGLLKSNDCPSASKATLMNMDKYFMWIHYERLHNHNKAKHNKTVCIFLGIYCKAPLCIHVPHLWCDNITMTSQITSLAIVCSTVYSGKDERKHQSSASLAVVRWIHRCPVNSPSHRASKAENVSIWWRHHACMAIRNNGTW